MGVHYLDMTKKQAVAALQEFLDERDGALERLRALLALEGQNPDELLDGTIESLVPLWQWTLSRLEGPQAPGATDPVSVPREAWPSWERYTREQETILSWESLQLLDGLVSYLAEVITSNAPAARWEVARHRMKRYALQNHPALVSDHSDSHGYLPAVPVADARAKLRGLRESPDDRIAAYAETAIREFTPSETVIAAPTEDEPLVGVEGLGNDPDRGRELEMSIREDIAHEHSRTVDQLAKELKQQDGIAGVVREDREVLLVRTPTWTPAQLEEWAVRYLQSKLT